jgi:hypothetical protein
MRQDRPSLAKLTLQNLDEPEQAPSAPPAIPVPPPVNTVQSCFDLLRQFAAAIERTSPGADSVVKGRMIAQLMAMVGCGPPPSL